MVNQTDGANAVEVPPGIQPQPYEVDNIHNASRLKVKSASETIFFGIANPVRNIFGVMLWAQSSFGDGNWAQTAQTKIFRNNSKMKPK